MKSFFSKSAWVAVVAVLSIGLAQSALSGTKVEVPAATSLRDDAVLASTQGLPILLVFEGTYCSYCEVLEREIIKPMILSGEYTNKIIIRKVVIDSFESVQDFNGKAIDPADLASRYRVPATPTLVFVDAQGRELADKIVGINTIEMFGGRVDAAIDVSLERLRHQQVAQTGAG